MSLQLTRRSWPATCAALVLLAATVRVAAYLAAPPTALIGDEIYYSQVAANLERGLGHVFHESDAVALRAWRPPGMAFTLAAVLTPDAVAQMDETVASVPRPIALQIALGSLLAGAVAWLGGLLIDRRSGLAAGLLCAGYPTLVAFSHYLWSATLTALLLTTALALAVRYASAPSAARAIAVGVVLGAAALVREVALPVALAIGWWWWHQAPEPGRMRALRHGALALTVAVACVAPWSLRNWRMFDRFVPVSTIGWFAAGEGNTFETEDWLLDTGPDHLAYATGYFRIRDELERADFARRWTSERIVAEQPLWLPKKLIRNGALLLSPDSYLLFKQSVGAYGDVSPAARAVSVGAVAVSWAIVAALGAWGIAIASPRARALGLAVLVVPVAVHLISNATSRFRLPWLGLWLVFAALGAVELPHWRTHWRQLGTPARAGWIGFVSFLLIVAFPYFAVYGGRR